jgi:hypothetical protein
MIDDTDVRSWLKDNFGHDFGAERFVMPQNAAGAWLVEPKALGPIWSETCRMNFQRLFRETVLNTSLMDSINLHGVMKPISNKLRKMVYERDHCRCVTCGATDHLSLDHIIPWSLGGEDTMENLQTMCRSCNSRKGNRVDVVQGG